MIKTIKYWKNIITARIRVFVIERCNAKVPGVSWKLCSNEMCTALDELLHSEDERIRRLGERLLATVPDAESYYVKSKWLKSQNK